MADADSAAALEVRRPATRDAVEEAKTARLEKSAGFPSLTSSGDGSQAEARQSSRDGAVEQLAKALRGRPVAASGDASPIEDGPGDGPLIKTDPVISPQAHAVGINATRAVGEIAGERPIGMIAKAGASAWEAAVTAEPGNRLRTALTHAGFDFAAEHLKGAAGVRHPDPNIDGAVDQVRDKLDGLIDRTRPARPKPDDDESLVH